MELWIRNQEKDILIKVDNLELDDERNDIYTHNCIDNMQMTYTLGRYKSKERALEVLDEIQKNIERIGEDYLLVDEDGTITGQKHYEVVYQMPEEWLKCFT